MQPWVLLNLLALALSFFKQADDLARPVRQYDDGFALTFGCFLGFSVHVFGPLRRVALKLERQCVHEVPLPEPSACGGTSLIFLSASARSMARSASDTASAFVIAWPVAEGLPSSTTDHFQMCRPTP